MDKQLTAAEAAEKLGVTTERVYALIHDGRLPAERFGRAYVINEKDLKLVIDRKPGRPKKSSKKKNAPVQKNTEQRKEE